MKAILAIVVLVVIGIGSLLFLSTGPSVKLDPGVKVIGMSTPVKAEVASAHGVRHVAAYIEQGGTRFPVMEQSSPSHRIFWERNQAAQTVTFEAGKNKAPNLKEGDARLVVEVVADDFRGGTADASIPVKVVLSPPRVVPDDAQHYINQGGMELAVMTPGGSWSEAGVRVGKREFRSLPLPGRAAQRFGMIALSWDEPADVGTGAYSRNLAGTDATAKFWYKLFPKKFRARDLDIDDAQMEQMVSKIDPGGTLAPGPDTVSRFLKINGELRRK